MTEPQPQTTDEPESTARNHAGDPAVRTEPIEDLDAAPDADEIAGGNVPCAHSACGYTSYVAG